MYRAIVSERRTYMRATVHKCFCYDYLRQHCIEVWRLLYLGMCSDCPCSAGGTLFLSTFSSEKRQSVSKTSLKNYLPGPISILLLKMWDDPFVLFKINDKMLKSSFVSFVQLLLAFPIRLSLIARTGCRQNVPKGSQNVHQDRYQWPLYGNIRYGRC